jgi:hypothetical protein
MDLLRFLSNATIETETLLWIWRGDIKGTWNELVSGVRERVEVGRYSERY